MAIGFSGRPSAELINLKSFETNSFEIWALLKNDVRFLASIFGSCLMQTKMLCTGLCAVEMCLNIYKLG